MGDVNGDGKADLVWCHTNGDVAVWLGNGLTQGLKSVIATVPDPGWVIVDVGDVDGDGKADLVWRHTNGEVAAWLGNGLTQGPVGVISGGVALEWEIQ